MTLPELNSEYRLDYLKRLATRLNRDSREVGQRVRDIAATQHTARARLAELEAQGARHSDNFRPTFGAPRRLGDGPSIALRRPGDAPGETSGEQGPKPDPASLPGQIVAARKRLAELDQARADAEAEYRKASENWNAAARLSTACRAYAQENKLPLPVAVDDHSPRPLAGAAVHGEVW